MKHFCSFSEAIREGAKLRPQTRVDLFSEEGTCAVGAGLHAMYEDEMPSDYELTDSEGRSVFEFDVLQSYPYMAQDVWTCPHKAGARWWQVWRRLSICTWSDKSERRHSRLDTVAHLNDIHDWTRERIADWLESEEDKLGFVTLTESVKSPELAEVTV